MKASINYPGGQVEKSHGFASISQMAVAVLLAATLGCSPKQSDYAQKAYEEKLGACRSQFLNDPLVPIVGGGYLDTRRFAFNVPTLRYTDGQCGTDGFTTSFYWTGEKIVPNSKEFTGLDIAQVPKEWRQFNVAAVLGNQRKGRECRLAPRSANCPAVGHKNPGLPGTWPTERIVQPKAFPTLEIWLPERQYPTGVREVTFVIKGWTRPDGITPRTISCMLPRGKYFGSMSREEIESIDFREAKHGYPCQVEFWDFEFRGGAARVKTGTEALNDVAAALPALQNYISESIHAEP